MDTTLIIQQLRRPTKYYVKCFGNLIEITKEEALKLDTKLVILK